MEPFLVDDRADHHHPGRIARASLERLGICIRRDLLPHDARNLVEAVLPAPCVRAEHVTCAFQYMAVAAIKARLAAGADDEKAYRRMLAQIGAARASEDAMQ